MVNAIGLEPFINGDQPHSCSAEITEVPADAPLLPPGVEPDLTHEHDGLRSHLATGPGWTLVALRRRAGAATVRVRAADDELARQVLAQVVATARVGEPAESEIPVGFWQNNTCGPGGSRSPRTVDLPTWSAIRANHPESTVDSLDRLMCCAPTR